ncbi:MAG TPA: hypothetical protein VGO80_14110 [Solirubrobacteraceae bacterium]|jgi:hypothetical protein|nr:hypothetical protein [Solirubrobacteraceae bacterium]
MSDLDTRKTGGGQTVSYASVRLESETLLPKQLIDMLIGAARNCAQSADVDVHIQSHGTGLRSR